MFILFERGRRRVELLARPGEVHFELRHGFDARHGKLVRSRHVLGQRWRQLAQPCGELPVELGDFVSRCIVLFAVGGEVRRVVEHGDQRGHIARRSQLVKLLLRAGEVRGVGVPLGGQFRAGGRSVLTIVAQPVDLGPRGHIDPERPQVVVTPTGSQFGQLAIDLPARVVTLPLPFGKIAPRLMDRLLQFQTRLDLRPIRHGSRIKLEFRKIPLRLDDFRLELRVLGPGGLQLFNDRRVPLPGVDGQADRSHQSLPLAALLLQLPPFRPGANQLLDLRVFRPQPPDLLIESFRALRGLGHRRFGFVVLLGSERTVPDLFRQSLEFRQQRVDRGLRAPLLEQVVRLPAQFGNHLVRAAGPAEAAAEEG